MTEPPEAVHVEYVYGTFTGEDERGYLVTRVVPFRIAKRTAQRVYYVRDEAFGPYKARLGFIDRQRLEADGQAYTRRFGHPDHCLHLEPPDVDAWRRKPSLGELKQQMADAHPDRGGSDETFIAARQRYQRAKEREHA